MSGEDYFHNISVPSGNLNGDILCSENIKKTDPCSNLDTPYSGQEKQDAPCNSAPNYPQAVVLHPRKRSHYKLFSETEGGYLYVKRCVPVQVTINNPRPGFELSVMVKYKALTHQCQAVQACLEHCNMPPAESKGMDLRTPNKAGFALMAGDSRSVQYKLEGLHPMISVTLNTDAERDVVDLVFTCFSSCKPHKICGKLMLLHLNIRNINTRKIVSSSVLTVRVAADMSARASQKYEEDMLGKITLRCPAKRRMPVQGGEGLDDIAEVVDVVAKYTKREHGNERKDDASVGVDVMDPELNQDDEERDNISGVEDIDVDHPEVNYNEEEWDDLVGMAEDLNNNSGDHFASSNIMNGTGIASNQLTLLEASYSTKKSMVNIGATPGISLHPMACTDNLPILMVNNQTSMVPMANHSALTVVNQNQTPPEECSLTCSTSLNCSNNPPVSGQEYAVSADVAFVVTGLTNPESDCPKIQQYIESLGATCSQVAVVTAILDDI